MTDKKGWGWILNGDFTFDRTTCVICGKDNCGHRIRRIVDSEPDRFNCAVCGAVIDGVGGLS